MAVSNQAKLLFRQGYRSVQDVCKEFGESHTYVIRQARRRGRSFGAALVDGTWVFPPDQRLRHDLLFIGNPTDLERIEDERAERLERSRDLLRCVVAYSGVPGIYFIEGDSVCKIGKSIDLGVRLKGHAYELHRMVSGKLRARKLLPCKAESIHLVESALHWIYRFNRDPLGRELFALPLDPDPRSFGSAADVLKYAYEQSSAL